MFKILISAYIAAILLFAGFAEANQPNFITSDFQKIRHLAKVMLPVEDARFDSRKELLTLSGRVNSSCINSVKPELLLDQRASAVLVSVTAQGESCFNDSRNFYEIVVDIKAFFAENTVNKNGLVSFHIDNFVDGNDFSFNYLAKQQIPYIFDTVAHGKIEIDHRTNKIYLIGRGSKTEVFSRINLKNYADRFVQVKGLIQGTFSIIDEANQTSPKLVIGQLTALK